LRQQRSFPQFNLFLYRHDTAHGLLQGAIFSRDAVGGGSYHGLDEVGRAKRENLAPEGASSSPFLAYRRLLELRFTE